MDIGERAFVNQEDFLATALETQKCGRKFTQPSMKLLPRFIAEDFDDDDDAPIKKQSRDDKDVDAWDEYDVEIFF